VNGGINRRRFIGWCASCLAAGAGRRLWAGQKPLSREYDRVRLVDPRGHPLRADALAAGVNYLFHYPYVTTPCFLINLGEPAPGPDTLQTQAGGSYRWRGGTGPGHSLVAFSAICSHRMTYPARSVSFINYRHRPTPFVNEDKTVVKRAHIIYCCSENSVYDAADGARVLGGPAPQPLAAIDLEYDSDTGQLHATGTDGGELFERFFDKFGFHLALEYGVSDIRQRVTGTAEVVRLDDYTRNQVLC